MELALKQSLDVRVVALPEGTPTRPTIRPASRRGSTTAEAYAVHRVRLELDARARPAARVPAGAGGAERDPGVARAPRRVAARERPARPDGGAADDRRRVARLGALAAPRGRRRQARAERPRRRARAPRARSPCSPSSAPEHFDSELNRALRSHLARRRPPSGRADAGRGAGRPSRTPRRSTRRPPGAPPAPARAPPAPRARRRRRRARRRSSRPSSPRVREAASRLV